jgi:hypothetical protein
MSGLTLSSCRFIARPSQSDLFVYGKVGGPGIHQSQIYQRDLVEHVFACLLRVLEYDVKHDFSVPVGWADEVGVLLQDVVSIEAGYDECDVQVCAWRTRKLIFGCTQPVGYQGTGLDRHSAHRCIDAALTPGSRLWQ